MAEHLSGFLNLNKPAGVTSRDVVNVVARQFKGHKVGHAGTLDPLATGVLVVAVGSATRLVDYVQQLQKRYTTVVRLGATSDTDDSDGEVRINDSFEPLELHCIESAVSRQIGPLAQVPPNYSAIKQAGRRAYDLARNGAKVSLEPRIVNVYSIRILNYEWPRLALEVECGAGTYIRAIARDIGLELGCGGLVEVLERTSIGSFAIADAIDPQGLSRSELEARLIEPSSAVQHLPKRTLDASEWIEIQKGRAISLKELETALQESASEAVLLGADGKLVGIAEVDVQAGLLRPRRVLANQTLPPNVQ